MNWFVPNRCPTFVFKSIANSSFIAQDCTILTPEDVFKTSGHVERFADWMCKDPIKGEYLRADHLVEGVLEARLEANKKVNGVPDVHKIEPQPQKAKKKKSVSKDTTFTKLDDATVNEYEDFLAQVK